MTKETVRYPDSVVEAVEAVVDDGVFESKSEFYRFSAEFVLDSITDDYDPETYDYEEIREELAEYGDLGGDASDGGDDGAFVESLASVRKHGLRGEFDAAADLIDDGYDDSEVEAVVLEEFLHLLRARETQA